MDNSGIFPKQKEGTQKSDNEMTLEEYSCSRKERNRTGTGDTNNTSR